MKIKLLLLLSLCSIECFSQQTPPADPIDFDWNIWDFQRFPLQIIMDNSSIYIGHTLKTIEEIKITRVYDIHQYTGINFPVMKEFVGIDPFTHKPEWWLVTKNMNIVVFSGKYLPNEYLNASEFKIYSAGSLIYNIENQLQPKNSGILK